MATTQLKSRRGTTAQMDAFTGANSEITVNHSKKIVVVHDGITAGGFEMADLRNPQIMQNKTLAGQANTTANTYFTGANTHFASANVMLGSVANVHITGGSSGQQLQTDGSGNLSWSTPSAVTANTDLAQGIVGPYELANNAVSNTHLQQGAVGPYELANNAVEGVKLASSAVSANSKFGAGVISPHALASGAVTAGKIAADGVSANTQLAQSVVGSYELANNAVSNTHVQQGAVGSYELANSAVSNTHIQDGSVGSAEIASNAVGTDELSLTTVSQAEAEAGTATDERVWTAERVKQAIDALASGEANQIDFDGTTGRVLRMIKIIISNGTSATTIKPEGVALAGGNESTISVEDNLGKGGDTGNFALNAGGDRLTIEGSGLSGNAKGPVAAVVQGNASGTDLTVLFTRTGNDLALDFRNATTEAALDLTTLVDTGRIQVQITYLTES